MSYSVIYSGESLSYSSSLFILILFIAAGIYWLMTGGNINIKVDPNMSPFKGGGLIAQPIHIPAGCNLIPSLSTY